VSKQKVVLPADVYDALELSALIHGGIGSGCLSKPSDEIVAGSDDSFWGPEYVEVPSCIIGHALFLDGYSYSENHYREGASPVTDALVEAFPALLDEVNETTSAFGIICEIESLNDNTVDEYAKNQEATLTWKQWTKRMRVVRGEN